jgi:hypothetical protein
MVKSKPASAPAPAPPPERPKHARPGAGLALAPESVGESPMVEDRGVLLICIRPLVAVISVTGERAMGVLEDMIKALDRIPGWKRLQELPSEVDQLKASVAALEEKLSDKWPAECADSVGPEHRGLNGCNLGMTRRVSSVKIGSAQSAMRPICVRSRSSNE